MSLYRLIGWTLIPLVIVLAVAYALHSLPDLAAALTEPPH